MKLHHSASFILFFFFCLSLSTKISAQCCSGGSGCPIAGGASQGVLQEKQLELNTNFQFINTDKFYKGSKLDTNKYFSSYSSQYQYFKLGYGLSKNFTVSLESGYFFGRKEVGLPGPSSITYSSQGIGDIIVFPRYNVLNQFNDKTKTEATIGLGFKVPLGSYNAKSTFFDSSIGSYSIIKPPSVQLSSGSQDIIFNLFLFHGWTPKNFRVFANAYYIKKGWNPLSVKMGDYSSLALFIGKTYFKNLGLTLQLKGEHIQKMRAGKDIDVLALYNVDTAITGSDKIFFTPQISYSKGKFTVYATTEIPIFQFVNNIQVGSKYQTTFGLSYRFMAKKNLAKALEGTGKWYCPMHPEEVSEEAGICPKCKMDLIKSK